QKTGALIDSGALAATLAQLVPLERTAFPASESRPPTPPDLRAAARPGAPSARGTPDAGRDDGGDLDDNAGGRESPARAPGAPPVVHSLAEILQQARPPTPRPR